MGFQDKIRKRIITRLKSIKWSRYKLANHDGHTMCSQTVYRFLRGDGGMSVEHLKEICDLVEIDMA